METEKRNHSNDPSSKQPIDEQGRYAEKTASFSDKEEIKPSVDSPSVPNSPDSEQPEDEFAEDEDLEEFFEDDDLDEYFDDYVAPEPVDETGLPKRKDFDPNDPSKGFEAINKDMYDNYVHEKDGYLKWHRNCQRCYACFELWNRGYDVKAGERFKDGDERIFDKVFSDTRPIAEQKRKEYESILTENGGTLFLAKMNGAMTDESYKEYNKYNRKVPKYLQPFVGLTSDMAKFIASVSFNLKGKHNQSKVLYGLMSEQAKANGIGSRYAIRVEWKGGGAHIFNAVYEKEGLVFYDAQSGERFKEADALLTLQMAKCSTVAFARTDDRKLDPTYLKDFIRKPTN